MAASMAAGIEAARAAERAARWDEALSHYESAFSCLATEGDAPRAADLLRWIGRVHRQRGETELAVEHYEASLALSEKNGLTEQIAQALNSLAIVEQYRGGFADAESLYMRAWQLAEAAGDQRLAAMIEQNLGTIANIRGDFETARLCYGSALERFSALDDAAAQAWALNNIAMTHVDLDEWDEAAEKYGRAAHIAHEVEDVALQGSIALNSTELFLKRGDLQTARESCDRAFEVFTRAGSKLWLAEARKFYGIIYRDTQKPALAHENFATATALARAVENRLLEAEVASEWALLHIAQKQNREALETLNRAYELFSGLKAGRELHDLDRRLDRLEANFLQVMQAWAESIESKDLYTAGHCERVANYACVLAEEIGITGRDLRWFRMGAFLHDVGKIDVPSEVLNKPGKLEPGEWELMKQHTVSGDAIVADLDFPWDIRPMVRNHHERWDGAGYPDGLARDSIPLNARILCVADVYDALTTSRSYRSAMQQDKALEIMAAEAGLLFDPDLFFQFRELVAPGKGLVAAL